MSDYTSNRNFNVKVLDFIKSGWAFLDSNQRPQPYQDCALTN